MTPSGCGCADYLLLDFFLVSASEQTAHSTIGTNRRSHLESRLWGKADVEREDQYGGPQDRQAR